jgi:heme-degrading monooxygenase HmoA
MFYHVSIHRPKSGKEPDLIESMHRFGASLQGAPGLISVQTLQDAEQGVLMGLAIWESREAWQASIHLAREAIANDPFDEWESTDVDGFRLVDV